MTDTETRIAELQAEHAQNLEAILAADALKLRQREIVRELAKLYRERAREQISALRGK